MLKRFQLEAKREVLPVSTWIENDAGRSQGSLSVPQNSQATKMLKEIMGEKVFSFPKPIELISAAMRAAGLSHRDIVMDFFAGSGTTGHGVWSFNAANRTDCRFVLVQIPEVLDPTKDDQKPAVNFCEKLGKPKNIAELTKERLRRAGAKVKAEHPDADIDTGFRVYKLDSSNIRPWQPDADNLEASLLDAVSNIVHGRSEEDLLVELLLKTGIDLTTPEEVREIAGKTVHALGGGTLIVCLADIADADAEKLGHGIAEWQAELDPPGQTTLYFKDEGFASACAKANLAAILRQRMGDRIAKLASI
jgi:adenine-specific DNA-methyltransferase